MSVKGLGVYFREYSNIRKMLFLFKCIIGNGFMAFTTASLYFRFRPIAQWGICYHDLPDPPHTLLVRTNFMDGPVCKKRWKRVLSIERNELNELWARFGHLRPIDSKTHLLKHIYWLRHIICGLEHIWRIISFTKIIFWSLEDQFSLPKSDSYELDLLNHGEANK